MRKLIGLDHEHHPSTTTPEPASPASLAPAPSILAEPTAANPASITAPSQDVSADGLQETTPKASSSKKNSHSHSHSHLPSESHSHSHRQPATFSPSDPVPLSEDAEAIHKKKHKRRSRILPSDYPRELQPIEDLPTVPDLVIISEPQSFDEPSTDQSTPLAETPFVGTATLAVDPQSPSATPPPPLPPSTSAALAAETEAVGFEMAPEPDRGPSPAHDAPNPLSRKLKHGFQRPSSSLLLLAASAEDPDHNNAAFPAAPVATQVSSPHPALAPVAAAFSLPPRRTIATDRKDAGFLKTRLAYDSQEKTLVVHLIEAYDVLPMDSNGFSDPYVKIYLDSKKVFKSPTLKKTLDPAFNVTATIPKLDLSQTLLIEIWDWDRIGSDDFIGYLELPLSLFAAHPVREQWDALNPEKPRSKKASKSSKTSAPSTPATSAPSTPATSAPSTPATSAPSTPATSVTVLPDTMAFAPSLLPLPFVSEALSPLPPSSSSSSSSTMTPSSSSIFVPSPSPADASSPASVLPAKLPELPPPPLSTVASPPPARRPDPQFSSSNVTPSDPESAAWPVPPSGKDADFGGFLLTSLRYDAKERRVLGDIFEARDLLPMDSNGLSDPYVKVFLGNNAKAVHTTATIKKTLFPKFGESFSVALAECSGTLTFEVWDWDRLSKDDFIGSTSLELSLPRERVWDRLSHQATPIKKLGKKQIPLPISASMPQVDATSKSTPALPGDASLPLAANPATLNSNSPVFPSNPNIPSSSPSASSSTSSLTAGSRVIGTAQEGKEITVRVLAHFNAASSRFTCTFVAAQAYRGKPTSLRLTSEGAEKKVKLGDKVELKIPQRKRLEAKPAVEFELTVQDGKKQEAIGVGLISLEKEFGQETAPQQLSIHLVSSDKRDLRSNKPSSSAPALTADLLGELATQEIEAQSDQAAHENTRRIIEETRLDRREMRGSFFINKPLLYIPTHQDSLSHSLSRAAELSSHSQRQLDQLASYFASPDSRKDHPFLLQCLVILILLSLSCFVF
ncbi:MAG: hypothetical protein Q8P67_18915 [archaeon]|nr:hypothetical protein [archaeon]